MNFVKKQPDGSLIPQYPTIDDVFKSVGLGGFDSILQGDATKEVHDKRTSARQDLLRAYASFFSDPRGKMILEDLLDCTLRLSNAHPRNDVPPDVEVMYVRERKGQNAVMLHILRSVQDGMHLPAPGKQKKTRK